MATAALVNEADPFDVSRRELYAEDTFEEAFRRHRAEAPIHYVKDSHFGPYWSVSTYKPIVHIEALPKIFSSSWKYGGISIAFDPDKELEHEVRMPMFIAMDPPDHTALFELIEHTGDFFERTQCRGNRLELATLGQIHHVAQLLQGAHIGPLHRQGTLCQGDQRNWHLAAEQPHHHIASALAQHR